MFGTDCIHVSNSWKEKRKLKRIPATFFIQPVSWCIVPVCVCVCVCVCDGAKGVGGRGREGERERE